MTSTRIIGSQRELFTDHGLIDRMANTSLRLHEPVSAGSAILLDRPWEGPANFGSAVFRHGDRYLMYYRALTLDPAEENGVLCVAVSADGVTWTKPALGLVEHGGRRDTNIVATDCGPAPFNYNSGPWLDTRPGVPENERIKALTSEPISGRKHTTFKEPPGPKRLVFWASGDGFSFHKLEPQPDLVSNLSNCFDGGNSLFWSEAEQQYVLYYRFCDIYEGRTNTFRRTVARTTSKDLLSWTESVPMSYGDSPREQFYVNNTEPYFRAPHLYVALAARFMQGRRGLTEAQAAAIDLKTTHGFTFFNDCSDAVLMTSRAGTAQYDRTFMEAFVRPGLGVSNWVSRANYPLTGIMPCGNDRIMFFVARHFMQDSWHIERLTLRADGFASVTAPWAGGEMLTKQFSFSGNELELNYRTSAAGSMRLELQDAGGQPIPGRTLDDCPEIIGDEIARVVAWKRGSDIGALAGQPVRLRFVMKDADLFSLRFR